MALHFWKIQSKHYETRGKWYIFARKLAIFVRLIDLNKAVSCFSSETSYNLGKKLNVNFARISKTPPLHKVEFSLFSQNLKFKIKTRQGNSLIMRMQKIAEVKSVVSPEIWKHPKSEKKSFRISYTPKIAKMFPNLGHPQTVQRCFRISETPKQCKDVSEFRKPPNSVKMFPNFGYPETVQRCFRISETPKQCKDVSEFRIPSNSAKMFPNFGNPPRVQSCFRILETPQKRKEMFPNFEYPKRAQMFLNFAYYIHAS